MAHRLTRPVLPLMRLVAYCVAAAACIEPWLIPWRAGLVQWRSLPALLGVDLWAVLVVAPVYAGLLLVVMRPGVWRDRLITVSLLCPDCVAFGIAFLRLVGSVSVFALVWEPTSTPFSKVLSMVVTPMVVVLMLGAAIQCLLVCLRRTRSQEVRNRMEAMVHQYPTDR